MSLKSRPSTSGTNAISTFLEDLSSRGYQPLLRNTPGTLRFDLRDGSRYEHWYIIVKEGDVTVSRRNLKADSVMRAEKKVMEGLAAGTVYFITAFLQGIVEIEGDVGLLASFSRLFPGPLSPSASVAEGNRRAG